MTQINKNVDPKTFHQFTDSEKKSKGNKGDVFNDSDEKSKGYKLPKISSSRRRADTTHSTGFDSSFSHSQNNISMSFNKIDDSLKIKQIKKIIPSEAI